MSTFAVPFSPTLGGGPHCFPLLKVHRQLGYIWHRRTVHLFSLGLPRNWNPRRIRYLRPSFVYDVDPFLRLGRRLASNSSRGFNMTQGLNPTRGSVKKRNTVCRSPNIHIISDGTMLPVQALVELLSEKGSLTKEKVLERVKKLQAQASKKLM
jgi:hypothetical protein